MKHKKSNEIIESYVKKYKKVSKNDMKDLFNLYRNKGNMKARDNIFNSVSLFVIKVANHYKQNKIHLNDLIQSGTMGALKAIDLYDYTSKYEFITYAVNWIRAYILDEIALHNDEITLTPTLNNLKIKLGKTYSKLEQKLHREPTIDEISKEMKVPKDKINFLINLNNSFSLDEKIYGTETTTFGDIIPDNKNLSPEDYAINSVVEKISTFIDKSNLKHKDILKWYYGIGKNAVPLNHKEISEIKNTSEANIQARRVDEIERLKSYNNHKKMENMFHLTENMLS